MKRILLCPLISLSLAARLAAADVTNAPANSATNALALESLVSDALDHNPELNFYRAEITAAEAGRKTAALLPNPELSGSVGQKNSRDIASGVSAEGVAWSVSVMQPFEWPGRIGLRKAIANRDLDLARLGFDRFKIALAARVRVLGYAVFAAQEKAAAAREVAERFKALREVMVQREPAGPTPLLETRVIEATELTSQRKANDAELAAKTALFELNQLRGAAPDAPLTVARTQLTFHPLENRESLLSMARTNNFELRVRTVELAQQGSRLALAKNERYPAISIGPTYTEENALERDRTIGVGVSLPLPLWNRNTANIEAAAARQIQAETSLALAQREVERKVLEVALTYEARIRELGTWRPDSAEHFREAAELADRHYRLGAVSASIYVELQKQYLDAVESLYESRKDALEAAQSIELLTGLTEPLFTTREERP